MSFEQEWAGLVSDARSQQSTSMQLNGAGGDGGAKGDGKGGGKQLQVTPHVLRSHAGQADKVSDEFAKTDNETMQETEQVPGSMAGFASDEAFKEFQKNWRAQMKYLDGLYSGVAKALRTAATTFKATDVRSKADMDKVDLPPLYGPYLPKDGTSQGTDKPLYGLHVPTLPSSTEPKSWGTRR
ncbi:WXG100 family type VII secretion target [Streptomyces coffeae]|uniref:WXG100 family type VII secretion target n=1 Tax=Streptomyces coffeae TaxID=621382 RepID=A0ABS1NGF6_9ACTN|nr:WXG100 family type VII secretion target [Streptomyces coffeae]MBL1099169.1 WXG100 family type VII secretion target [Streptomyces coffeae]